MTKIIIDCNGLTEKGTNKVETAIFNALELLDIDIYVKIRREK
ncbi:hypothetical protein LCGC14_1301410 [marine sediment metagenome]|uniref:Uncharacterized protein n=1 Tax=marine sediment metagenome TaxID=412755 RepID=A0A0F9KQU6_9ZZZZ